MKISGNAGFPLISSSSPQMRSLHSMRLQNIVLYINHRCLKHIAHVSHHNFTSKTQIQNSIILHHTSIAIFLSSKHIHIAYQNSPNHVNKTIQSIIIVFNAIAIQLWTQKKKLNSNCEGLLYCVVVGIVVFI